MIGFPYIYDRIDMNIRQQKILSIIQKQQPISISEIGNALSENISTPTLNRALSSLKQNGYLTVTGKGPSLKYSITINAMNFAVIDADEYFKVDIEDRYVIEKFNRNIFKQIASLEICTDAENKLLEKATGVFIQKRKGLNKTAFKKEFERLMIELSWKSSQIEGNTYTLLDTEQLLKYDIASAQYSKEESIMLLNHKEAIEYSFENKEDFKEISVSKIIDIHSLLTKKLGVSKNLRTRLVRITGTKYLPPDNEFIIKEALEEMCALINNRKNIYEKAFLAILFISYIQPFEDGNKRTARLVGNAILQANDCCPLSYRSVTVTDYKKAMLLFYEVNNLTSFKKIFTDQYLFAVKNYF